MARNVISIITGLVVGLIVVAGIQMINYGLFPLPPGLDPGDREGMLEHIKGLPTLAYIILLVSHLAGSFMASITACKIATNQFLKIALGLGIFFMIMGIINMIRIPHPMWFMILDSCIYVPAAYLGYKISAS